MRKPSKPSEPDITAAQTKKPSASVTIRRRRDHLREMAARGTTHEKTIASEKLARLDARYDFSAGQEGEDIFAGWGRPAHARDAAPVLEVRQEWLDAANLVKWVFQDKFHATSTWRTTSDGAELLLHAGKADIGRFRPFAKDLLETIIAACAVFSSGRDVRALDRAPFLNGLYDGLIDERRAAGAVVPGFSPVAKKKPGGGKKRKNPAAPPPPSSAAIHPYDLGHDAGGKMRVAVPRDELCEGIRLAVAGPETEPPES
jgi:hypothetical protein